MNKIITWEQFFNEEVDPKKLLMGTTLVGNLLGDNLAKSQDLLNKDKILAPTEHKIGDYNRTNNPFFLKNKDYIKEILNIALPIEKQKYENILDSSGFILDKNENIWKKNYENYKIELKLKYTPISLLIYDISIDIFFPENNKFTESKNTFLLFSDIISNRAISPGFSIDPSSEYFYFKVPYREGDGKEIVALFEKKARIAKIWNHQWRDVSKVHKTMENETLLSIDLKAKSQNETFINIIYKQSGLSWQSKKEYEILEKVKEWKSNSLFHPLFNHMIGENYQDLKDLLKKSYGWVYVLEYEIKNLPSTPLGTDYFYLGYFSELITIKYIKSTKTETYGSIGMTIVNIESQKIYDDFISQIKQNYTNISQESTNMFPKRYKNKSTNVTIEVINQKTILYYDETFFESGQIESIKSRRLDYYIIY